MCHTFKMYNSVDKILQLHTRKPLVERNPRERNFEDVIFFSENRFVDFRL